MDRGFFAEQGIEVEPVRFPVSTECLNANVAGQIDFAMGNSLSNLFAIQQKEPGLLKIFLPMFETEQNYVSHLLVAKGSAIADIKSLRGKKVGTYTGATQLLYLRLFLAQQGLGSETDVEIVQVSPELQIRALEAGQYDALFTIEPYCTMAIRLAGAKSILPFARGRIVSPFPGGASSVNSNFLNRHPDVCKKVITALEKASDFIREQPLSAKRSLPKYTPVDELIAEESGIYDFFRLDDLSPDLLSKIREEAELFAQHKVLDGNVNVDGMLLQSDQLER